MSLIFNDSVTTFYVFNDSVMTFCWLVYIFLKAESGMGDFT